MQIVLSARAVFTWRTNKTFARLWLMLREQEAGQRALEAEYAKSLKKSESLESVGTELLKAGELIRTQEAQLKENESQLKEKESQLKEKESHLKDYGRV